MAMAATVIRVPFAPRNPNLNFRCNVGSAARFRLSPPGVAIGLRPHEALALYGFPPRRHRSVYFVGRAAHGGETSNSDVEVENTNGKFDEDDNESGKAWRQVLESFKDNALKMQGVSQEAYDIYSKKAMVILEETSKSMMIQADKASRDIAEIAKEIGEEGRQYIVAAAEKSPDSVKEIVEVFTSPDDDLRDLSKVRDFHIGISYGALLALGGFVSFMVTGSIAAIRFGIILGSALLALAISSLRAWRSGKSSPLLLKSQTAIAAIIFVSEWHLFSQIFSLPSALMTIISGAVVAFYIYRIIIYRRNEWSSLDYGSDE